MMQKVNYYSRAFAALALVLSFGCQENEDAVPGTGEGKIGMAFVLAAGDNAPANARVAQNGLEILEGYIQIKKLEMELEGRNAEGRFEKEYEVKFDEIKKVVFDRTDESSDFFFNIPEAEYKEIEMEIDLIDYRNEPSIHLRGEYQNAAGARIPVIFEYFGDDIDFEVEIESERDDEYFQVNRSNNPLALLEIHAHRWFRDLNQEELAEAVQEDGKILINRNSNKRLYSKVVNRIEAASEIEIDLR